MKRLDELARLLANPLLLKAARPWSGADVVIGFGPQSDHPWSSFYPKCREIKQNTRWKFLISLRQLEMPSMRMR
jgi:hypothetical protein